MLTQPPWITWNVKLAIKLAASAADCKTKRPKSREAPGTWLGMRTPGDEATPRDFGALIFLETVPATDLITTMKFYVIWARETALAANS